MAISSLVVNALPDQVQEAAQKLAEVNGVEVAGVDTETGNIVVTLEAENVDVSNHIAKSFDDIPGVLTVNLVYVNVEDEIEDD